MIGDNSGKLYLGKNKAYPLYFKHIKLKDRGSIIVIFTLFFTLYGGVLVAQDFNFSQFNPTRNYYNPAFTGMQKGIFRSNLIYRRLWPNFPGEFSTKFINLEVKTYNSYGLGLQAISNVEGEGFLKTNTLGASYSWQGMIDDQIGSFFQLGVNATYNTKQINFDHFIFSDELDEIYGDIYSTSFSADNNRQHYWDFAIGALVQFPTILRHRKVLIHTMGIALHHFTRPKDSFIAQDGRLPMKLTLHNQSVYTTKTYSFNKEDRLRFVPIFVFQIQGEDLLSSSSFNSFTYGIEIHSDPIFGGVCYNSQILNSSKQNYKALVFHFGIKLRSENKNLVYRIGYSYDMSTSQLSKSTQGAHEVGLTIDFHFPARYKYNIFSF